MKERPTFQLMCQTDVQSIYHMQMPRWLFSDPRYCEMSLDAKVTYTFLLNRFQLSRRNGWVNERGEVFVIFPRKALAKELRICEQRVTAAFKKLVELKLVWEKRCGRGDANRAQASRRQASRSQRRFFAAREDLHAVGSRITCRMLAVGPRRCLVDCYGYDLDMTQKEIRYAAIPDLRTEFHPGSEIDCIVKEYHPRTGELIVSAKETEVNPFFGAEERHPVGSRRFAMISGKYGGGVFCNLPDGVTCMCNYSYQHEDADFMVGEHVMLMVQRYDHEKLQMYGKIMSKW